ncbi:MAG: MFS transporter [Ignavibacteriales bacterium]|nr:MAG: MFS transporter [Ignavibacteriales bacterium]
MNPNWKKDITLFLISQSISLFGSMLVQYAIMWYIVLETESGVMMTIYIISGLLPTFFLSPFGGVWADRFNRKILIIMADSGIAVSTLILAILFLIGYDAIWLLFIAAAIRAAGMGIHTPAIAAFIPQIVPDEKLIRVTGINSSIQSVIMLISPMVSAALLTFASIEIIFFIDVITAAIAVVILIFFLNIPVHAKALEKQTTSYFRDMHEGIIYIKNHQYVKNFFIFCVGFYFLISPVAFLTPLQVVRSFGNDVWRLTAIEVLFSLGMAAGGGIMASWGGFKNKIHTMILSILWIGICTVIFGIVTNFWIYLSFMGLIGIAIPIFNTPSTVLLQQKVEENFLGRIFGVYGMISSSMMPLGMLLFGPVADSIKIEWMLIGTGVLLFIEGFFMLNNKELIKAGEPLSNPVL